MKSDDSERILFYRSIAMEILSESECITVGNATLYFINEKQDHRLQELEIEFDGEESRMPSQRKEFAQIVNYLNPASPTTTYATGIRGKHRQISDEAKVFKRLKGQFAIWKNTLKKDAEMKLKVHNYSYKDRDILMREINDKIKIAEGELAYIIENYDKLEVKIAGVLHEKSYPYIQYADVSSGERVTKQKSLSITVPNALYYTPTLFRSDMSIREFVKKARNPFGDIFYLKRE